LHVLARPFIGTIAARRSTEFRRWEVVDHTGCPASTTAKLAGRHQWRCDLAWGTREARDRRPARPRQPHLEPSAESSPWEHDTAP